MRRLLLAAITFIALPLAAQRPARWLATWAPSPHAAAPRPPLDSIDRVPTYADRTIRQIVRTTLGGDRVRIRFTNEYGERPLVIGAAQVAVRDTGASVRTGTGKPITFGGRASVTLRRGAVITSDPIDMAVPSLADLAISIWVADTIRATTRHALGLQTNYVSEHGDFTAATAMRADTVRRQWLWLAGVDVVNREGTGVIVAIGNSITDGAGSSADSNSRWPDVLARRLLGSREPAKAVVNAGISGNGVLSPITGPSALARFDRDVLMQPGVTHVIVLEGINDLSRGAASTDPRDSVGAQDLIFGYQQLIARAHERGLLIFGATLTPMANMTFAIAASIDARRRAVNEWIRTSGAFDGVIDFDAATRDPAQPDRFLPAYDSGDHLHPSDAGYKAMGEAIDLRLFRRKTPAAPRRRKTPAAPRAFDRVLLLEADSATSAGVSLGDIDRDGDLDIILAKGRHWPLQDMVLRNDGRGHFATAPLRAEPDRTYSAALADLDGDGDLDIVSSNDRPDQKLVYLNDGAGHFTVAGNFGAPEWSTRYVTVADLNGDARPDLIVANRSGGAGAGVGKPSFVCMNDGKGAFPRCTPLATQSATIIVAADLDRDGSIDLFVPHRDGGRSLVFWNDGKGSFSAPPVGIGPESSTVRAATAGDIDGDGVMDLFVGDVNAGLFVYLGKGGREFAEPVALSAGKVTPGAVAIADLNRDGLPDLVVGNDQLPGVILFNQGKGKQLRFVTAPWNDGRGSVYAVAIGDLDGDGWPDIAAARSDAVNALWFSGAVGRSTPPR